VRGGLPLPCASIKMCSSRVIGCNEADEGRVAGHRTVRAPRVPGKVRRRQWAFGVSFSKHHAMCCGRRRACLVNLSRNSLSADAYNKYVAELTFAYGQSSVHTVCPSRRDRHLTGV